MQFRETFYNGSDVKTSVLDLPDSKAAEQHADKIFQRANEAASMHSVWNENNVSIYFIASKKVGHGVAAAKTVYRLEPVV